MTVESPSFGPEKTTVVGEGPMGLALVSMIARNVDRVYLWVPDARTYHRWSQAPHIELGEFSFRLPYNVELVMGYEHFKNGSHALFLTIPSRQFEETTESILYHLDRNEAHMAVNITKGFLSSFSRRKHRCYLFHQLLHALREHHHLDLKVALVTGPSLLYDIVRNHSVFFQIATDDPSQHETIMQRMGGDNVFWSYSDDIIGSEVAGIMKNPLAILAGMADELPGVGSSFQGELMAAGFAEIRRINQALGGREETLYGRAGLADLSATFFSPQGRNRGFGKAFTHKLLSGESRPNILDQLQLFLVPSSFIEREVLANKNMAEGGLAITPITEIAEEFQIEVPLYQMLYDVLRRKKSPADLVTLLTGRTQRRNRIPVIRKKGRIELVASGRMISELLNDRILHHITLTRGMQARIKKQSGHILSSLEKRREKALKKRQTHDAKNFAEEARLWSEFSACREEEELRHLERLVRFYTGAIADYYVPVARTMLMYILAPFRWILGGLRPGSIGPIIGGNVREVRRLASNYPVFYVPTHRTHIDSVELVYGLFFRALPLPRFAAASSLMTNPLWGAFLRSMGAYAVDRESTRNILYLEVLTQYTTMMLESGIPALAYPEGTRSRTGGFQAIKTGLLSTAIEAFRESGQDIILAPITISHQWIPEDLVFTDQESDTGFWTFIRRRKRAYLDFADPIRVSDFADREEPTHDIADEIQKRWQSTFRVQPHCIIAKILSQQPGILTRADLSAHVTAFLQNHKGNLEEQRADRIIKLGIKRLKERRLITESRRGFELLNPSLIEFYGNMAGGAEATNATESAGSAEAE